jgi:superfamily II DNA or RNA helicase
MPRQAWVEKLAQGKKDWSCAFRDCTKVVQLGPREVREIYLNDVKRVFDDNKHAFITKSSSTLDTALNVFVRFATSIFDAHLDALMTTAMLNSIMHMEFAKATSPSAMFALTGKIGTGKTHIAILVCLHRTINERRILFVTPSKLAADAAEIVQKIMHTMHIDRSWVKFAGDMEDANVDLSAARFIIVTKESLSTCTSQAKKKLVSYRPTTIVLDEAVEVSEGTSTTAKYQETLKKIAHDETDIIVISATSDVSNWTGVFGRPNTMATINHAVANPCMPKVLIYVCNIGESAFTGGVHLRTAVEAEKQRIDNAGKDNTQYDTFARNAMSMGPTENDECDRPSLPSRIAKSDDVIFFNEKAYKVATDVQRALNVVGRKVVVFVMFKETQEELVRTFSHLLIDHVVAGSNPNAISDFKSDENVRVLILSQQWAYGINLNMADTLFVVDYVRDAKTLAQMTGRICRVDTPFKRLYYRFYSSNDVEKAHFNMAMSMDADDIDRKREYNHNEVLPGRARTAVRQEAEMLKRRFVTDLLQSVRKSDESDHANREAIVGSKRARRTRSSLNPKSVQRKRKHAIISDLLTNTAFMGKVFWDRPDIVDQLTTMSALVTR